MSAAQFDVYGVGNAIVDMIASESDAFLTAQDIQKGGMTLIEEARADALTNALPRARQSSGGSGANSMAGIGSFGGRRLIRARSRKTRSATFFAPTSKTSASSFAPRRMWAAHRPRAASSW